MPIIGAESKEQRGRATLEFLAASGQFWVSLHLDKIVAKMLHLSTETYNNEQVTKVF